MPGNDFIVTRSFKLLAYNNKFAGLNKHFRAQTSNFKN